VRFSGDCGGHEKLAGKWELSLCENFRRREGESPSSCKGVGASKKKKKRKKERGREDASV